MLNQTFALTDLPKVALLTFLEIALSSDNAIVLGIITRSLPKVLKKRALYFGILSAFFIRAAALLVISFVIKYRFIQGLGAFYLLFLSTRYFLNRNQRGPAEVRKNQSLWKVVLLIESLDLIFAIDSILAGVAFVSSTHPTTFTSKMWIVYFGGMIGLIGVRYAGNLFGSILSKFPNMEKAAHLMIGWIGIKLLVEIFPHPSAFEFSFWGISFILILFGFMRKK